MENVKKECRSRCRMCRHIDYAPDRGCFCVVKNISVDWNAIVRCNCFYSIYETAFEEEECF